MEDQKFDLTELEFRIRDARCEINTIDVQIERLNIERDKFALEFQSVYELYESLTKGEPTEIKPKRLKKTSDKPSENHIEV